MICKTIEIRDRATFIPALAIKLTPGCEADRYLMARAGFWPSDGNYIVLYRLADDVAHLNPFEWGTLSRTMNVAHSYVQKNFDSIVSGDVVDVEFVLGESDKQKVSEGVEYPL